MTSYTITIAPDDPSQATTTLTVELNGASARITELLVRAGDGDGLTPGQIPTVDLDLLLKAVTPTVDGQQAITMLPSPAADDATNPKDDERTVPDTQPAQAADIVTSVADEPATPIPAKSDTTEVAVPKQTSRAKAQATRATRTGGRKAAAVAKATNTTRKTKQTAKAEPSTGKGRSYRRSPSDLESVYQQAGGVAALADHYDVPRHTAQGWIRTLRRRQASSAQ
ncbi:hypothetical protein ABTX15_32170 [Micromonospora sp. NPDC094482]|uniref:hypothetical protein n=1 Tax=unclassified Micromonospora TaxID=2617518 RepID=UPI00332DBD2C